VAIGYCFINQLCVLYIAFGKCFYICDAVVVKSLYVTFAIQKEQFAFQVHALTITIKLDLGELCAGSSLVKSGSFHVLRHKADS